jgi:hypothetical protein
MLLSAAVLSARGTCNVAQEPPDITRSAFDSKYRRRNRPVVISNATAVTGARFRSITAVSELASAYGHLNVTLSSANAHSYGRKKMLLGDYLDTMHDVPWQEDGAGADEIYYLFGEHGEELQPLLAQYPLPRYAAPVQWLVSSDANAVAHDPALSFGVAADGSGVPFHFHADGTALPAPRSLARLVAAREHVTSPLRRLFGGHARRKAVAALPGGAPAF